MRDPEFVFPLFIISSHYFPIFADYFRQKEDYSTFADYSDRQRCGSARLVSEYTEYSSMQMS